MKGKIILMGAIMTVMVVMGTSLAALAGDTNTENTGKAESEPEFDMPEEKLIRNRAGKIVGIDATDEPVSVQYQDVDYEQLISSEQFREYEELGLTCDDKTKMLYFYGMEVQSLSDEYEEGDAIQYFTENWGTDCDHLWIDLSTVRDENDHLLYFKFYRKPLYDEFLYNFEDEEYGTEEELWEDGGIAVDETAEMDEESVSIAIIGGADGPTSIFLAGKSGSADGTINREDEIRKLYGLRAAKAEDVQTVGNIITGLSKIGMMPETGMSCSAERGDEGIYLDIQFEDSLPDTDETVLKLSGCGNIILALVDELSEVRFTYPVEREEKMQFTLYWDKQAAQNSLLEGDVKEYGKSLDKFSELFSNLG